MKCQYKHCENKVRANGKFCSSECKKYDGRTKARSDYEYKHRDKELNTEKLK